MLRVCITVLASAVFTGVIGYFLLPVLRALKAGQSIRLTYCEIGGQVIPEAVIVCGENGVAYVDGSNVPLVVDQDSEKVVFTGTQTN